MLDAAELAARLRAARIALGLSQDDAAEALDLPRTAVTNIETGKRALSSVELVKLASRYGRSVASFLENDVTEHVSIVLPPRTQQDGAESDYQKTVDDVLDLCREGATLRALLKQPVEIQLHNYSAPVSSAGDAIRQGNSVAREERRRLGLGSAPIGDIAALISGQGVWVAACRLPSDMSGLFVHDRRVGLAIIVNHPNNHAEVRRRFSYAHEFGHALFDRADTHRFTGRANADELVEKRANAFAAAFLMPPGGVEDQLQQLDKGKPSRQTQILYDGANETLTETEIRPPKDMQTITWQDVDSIARHFGVSYESVAWRLRNMGHVGATETDVLLQQKDRRRSLDKILKLSSVEPPAGVETHDVELRRQIVRLAIEAYRREEISKGRLRDLATKLKISGTGLIDLADSACLSLAPSGCQLES